MNPTLSFGIAGFMGSLILAAFWVAVGPTASAQPQTSNSTAAPKGNAENGKKLYNDVGCWQCHGYSGQGGAGAQLTPDLWPYGSFSDYVRKPVGQMPPYSPKVLSDAQMADIYAFLQSIPEPPDPDSIPMLKGD